MTTHNRTADVWPFGPHRGVADPACAGTLCPVCGCCMHCIGCMCRCTDLDCGCGGNW